MDENRRGNLLIIDEQLVDFVDEHGNRDVFLVRQLMDELREVADQSLISALDSRRQLRPQHPKQRGHNLVG